MSLAHALLIFSPVYSLRCYVLWRSHEPQGLWCLEMCAEWTNRTAHLPSITSRHTALACAQGSDYTPLPHDRASSTASPCAKAEAKLVHFEHILEGHRVWQVRGFDGGDRLVATGEAEVRGVSGVCCVRERDFRCVCGCGAPSPCSTPPPPPAP